MNGARGDALNMGVTKIDEDYKLFNTKKNANSASKQSYVLPRLVALSVFYLVILLAILVLSFNNNNAVVMFVCAGGTLIFTVCFIIACFGFFAKADKVFQKNEDENKENTEQHIKSEVPIKDISKPTPTSSDKTATNNISINKEDCIRIGKNHGLTSRELEVFTALLQGNNARDIEASLGISHYTVKTHIGSVYRKTEVHSQQELIDWFMKESRYAE